MVQGKATIGPLLVLQRAEACLLALRTERVMRQRFALLARALSSSRTSLESSVPQSISLFWRTALLLPLVQEQRQRSELLSSYVLSQHRGVREDVAFLRWGDVVGSSE